MIKHGVDVRNDLLPLQLKDVVVPSKDIPPTVQRYIYLVAANGEIVSADINLSWARFIAERVNDPVKENGNKTFSQKRLLARIVIPHMAIAQTQSRTVVTRASDGTLRIQKSTEYAKMVRDFEKNFPYYIKTKHNFPIEKDCHIQATFHIPSSSRLSVAELFQPLEQLLYDVGILNPMDLNIVRCWDGSSIVYEKEADPYIDVTIRENR